MEKMQFIKIENGNSIICETVATYHDDNTNNDFIVYADNTLDDQGKLKLYYSLYKKEENNIKLIQIEKNEDKMIALEFMKEVIKNLK